MALRRPFLAYLPILWVTLLSTLGWRAFALDSIEFDLGSLNARGFKLEKVRLAMTRLAQNNKAVTLSIARLTLPKPFDDWQLVHLSCPSFGWRNGEMWCRQGRASIRSKRWASPTAAIEFRVKNKEVSLHVSEIAFAGGIGSIEADDRNGAWRLNLNFKNLDAAAIAHIGQKTFSGAQNSRIDLIGDANGLFDRIDSVNIRASSSRLTLQMADGRLATENLALSVSLNARFQTGRWHWQSHLEAAGGGFYLDPVYLDTGNHSVEAEAEGDWQSGQSMLAVRRFHYRQAGVGKVQGDGIIRLNGSPGVQAAQLSLESEHLDKMTKIYVKPFVEQTAWEGLSATGTVKAELSVLQRALAHLTLSFDRLRIDDSDQRLGLTGGKGTVRWSVAESVAAPSKVSWERLNLLALPFGKAGISFLSRGRSVELLEKTRLPLLGGYVAINQFFWQTEKRHEPEIYFDGNIHQVALEQLTKALNWAPMAGTISGRIPGVEYRDRALKFGGELIVRVFDGVVKIGNLALSGLFSELPSMSADIELERLDMDQITRHFSFGGITGRVSGFINRLVLENWRPVTFFAWFGTPVDDDSSHRISQKAVNNIASIGGGGANILSGTVLRLFDTFGYDRLGFGCYLHRGVCQLMGLEATETGYTLIKGGGLPRIDVIGYNSRVDWNVLVDRLKRVTAPNEVIIQ